MQKSSKHLKVFHQAILKTRETPNNNQERESMLHRSRRNASLRHYEIAQSQERTIRTLEFKDSRYIR